MSPRKSTLRAVGEGEAPPPAPSKPLTVGEAAGQGNRLQLLIALRTRIAKTVEDPRTPPRDLAALSRRLLEIAKEIEAILAADGEGDDIGQAAATPDEEWSDI